MLRLSASFLDALNNWYIRRSRERFWSSEASQDKQDAYDTLFTVLTTLCKATAPLLPLLTEAVYKGLTAERSVHLVDWPEASKLPEDAALVADMDRVRDVCSAALGLRRQHDLRVRQPLASLQIVGAGSARLESFEALIRDEVNVKQVLLSEDLESYATFQLKVDARKLGPRLGPAMKDVIKAAKQGKWQAKDDGIVEVDGHSLTSDEYTILLQAKDGIVCQALPKNDALVILDTELDESLIAEGLARDVVRAVQQARKDAELQISDRIRLELVLPASYASAVETHRSWLAEQTLAQSVSVVEAIDAQLARSETTLGEDSIVVGLAHA